MCDLTLFTCKHLCKNALLTEAPLFTSTYCSCCENAPLLCHHRSLQRERWHHRRTAGCICPLVHCYIGTWTGDQSDWTSPVTLRQSSTARSRHNTLAAHNDINITMTTEISAAFVIIISNNITFFHQTKTDWKIMYRIICISLHPQYYIIFSSLLHIYAMLYKL